jgi:hypothetical protein
MNKEFEIGQQVIIKAIPNEDCEYCDTRCYNRVGVIKYIGHLIEPKRFDVDFDGGSCQYDEEELVVI